MSHFSSDRKAVAKTKRRIEITVEKHRLIVLSARNQSTNAWCEACCAQVQMVTPDQAAQLCSVSTRKIYSLIETERLHFTETEKGFSLICLHSLKSSEAPERRAEPAMGPSRIRFGGLMKRVLKRR